MSDLQEFLLGLMAAYTPGVVFLTIMLYSGDDQRSPHRHSRPT